MKLYAVFKLGIFIQECNGVFSSIELAEVVAAKLLAEEVDDYHNYEIHEFHLDEAGDGYNVKTLTRKKK